MQNKIDIVSCSDSFCVAPFFKSKYKALRGAFVVWRRLERQNKKVLQKNIQRLRQWSHEFKEGDESAYWKMRNLLFEMAQNEAD